MKTIKEITASLNVIRECLDADVIDTDISTINNKLLKLTQLVGLSAETKASAKKLLGIKELEAFKNVDKSLPPSVQIRIINAECFEENAVLDYADRLNSGVVHSMESLRSCISLYKEEMKIGFNQIT